jgi:hypothetical protein
VVQIFATSYTAGDGLLPRSGDLIRTERASGSGVIVDPAGYIITNAHVVRGAGRLRVEVPRPSKGTSILGSASDVVGAQIVGMDLETDLAVLKIGGTSCRASVRHSDELKSDNSCSPSAARSVGNSVTLIVGAAAAHRNHRWSGCRRMPRSIRQQRRPARRLRGRRQYPDRFPGGGNEVGFVAEQHRSHRGEQIKATGRAPRNIGVRVPTYAGARHGPAWRVITASSRTSHRAVRPSRRDTARDILLSLEGKPMETDASSGGLYPSRGRLRGIEVLREVQMRKPACRS